MPPPPSDDVSPDRTTTVCIVEDHEILRNAMATLISDRGHRVVAAVGSVAAGLDAILALRPAIAVVDNQLPDGRGVDLCRTLGSLAPDVAVVLHSGAISPELAIEAGDAGAVAVVTKSIRGADLLTALDTLRAGSGDVSADEEEG